MRRSRRTKPALERFWPKVDRRGDDECWLWLARIDSKGYGQFFYEGKQARAHRAAYVMLVGPIPGRSDLDHLCRNRACVNPRHLEPVSRRENLLRGETLVSANARKTHCPAGHKYTTDNTKVRRGSRECRRCINERAKEWRRGRTVAA